MNRNILNLFFCIFALSLLAGSAYAVTIYSSKELIQGLAKSQPSNSYSTFMNTIKPVDVAPIVYNYMIQSRPKAIIFRDDDANSFFCVDATLKPITNTLIRENIPQVIGVTPKTMAGYEIRDDTNFMNYINSIKGNSKVEIAMHGYQHFPEEFGSLSLSDANTKLSLGLSIFRRDLGITPRTFIAPDDAFNNNALTACYNNGFTTFSTEMANDQDSFKTKYCRLMHMPSTVDMYDWESNSFMSTQEVESECLDSLNTNHVCVIVFHHWQFSDDGCKTMNTCSYNKLLEVIKWAQGQQKQGVKLLTMQQYRTATDLCVSDP